MSLQESKAPKGLSETLTQHLLRTEPEHVSGDFTMLMMAIQTAVKVINSHIRNAGMQNNFGAASATNASGDDQAKLDVLSNDVFKFNLVACGKCFVLCSEEETEGVLVESSRRGPYIVCFHPLDGSSNIDCNVTVGTIWGVWKYKGNPKLVGNLSKTELTGLLLRPGVELVSSGYAMYGASTEIVMTCGDGVHGFTLDSTIGEFVLTKPRIHLKSSPQKKIFSANEGNAKFWSEGMRDYFSHVKFKTPKPYSARYIGSMVGDIHRTLLYGGVFAYPGDSKAPRASCATSTRVRLCPS